ncbi:UDP-glucuronosyl/UDP-glucosyltransferase [Parasponia andersonii]|uniref:Glycosyltransferase n=1 Tax=Parasponia andersonii TaxID=3476 RepID=A0A2P5CH12_PARAD|nr:UDP-glucuronosyl/UDP-glucosyltransferase [Parasponia andersonii]
MSTPKPLHAVVFSISLQGHVIPSVHLAIKLASKGFTITFVNTQVIHHQITSSVGSQNDDVDIFASARDAGLDIRYKTVSDGFPLGFDRYLNVEQYLEGHLHVFPAHVDELVRGLVETADPPISCLVADTFFGWQSVIAKKYDLFYVSFWTEPALVFTLYYYLDLLKINGHYASQDSREDTIDYIPGIKAIEPKDLTSHLQETDVSTAMSRLINKVSQDMKKADFVLCNTVHELESEPISAIQEVQPMYAIGPLFPSGFSDTKSVVPTSLKPESDCTQWLNTKPHGSVLYISFGSFASCGKNDIDEIAHGLLLSKVNFVWVLRTSAISYEEPYVLPNGFEDEVKGRGLTVTWTNQVEVISHPAIGGFLTHCGWNSVLESIWYGVPMLCFPLMTDQLTNRKLVVDDWRIGANLCDRKPLTRFEVAEKINRLMNGKSADELRIEVMKAKQTLRIALAKDGSSERNLCQFIKDVKTKIVNKV